MIAYCKTRLLDGAVTIGQVFAWLLDLSEQRSDRDLSRPGRALQIPLDPAHAPATELASLYHDGREIESTYGVGQEALPGTASEPARKDPRSRRAANRKADAGTQRIPLPFYTLRHRGGSGPPLIHPCRPRRASPRQESRCIPPMQDCQYLKTWCAMRLSTSEPSRGRGEAHGFQQKMGPYRIRHRGRLSREVNSWQPEIALLDAWADGIEFRVAEA